MFSRQVNSTPNFIRGRKDNKSSDPNDLPCAQHDPLDKNNGCEDDEIGAFFGGSTASSSPYCITSRRPGGSRYNI